MHKILISACLLGEPVRYDGNGKPVFHERLETWKREGRLVPFCPEMAAGLPAPRPPSEIEPGREGKDVLAGGARVLEDAGVDVTDAILAGAQGALALAREQSCAFALLSDGSPTCGSTFIYDGRFQRQTKPGLGVAAALLSRNGIRVFAESQVDELAAALEDGT
ncbi:MAG: DUF523 domain-containing protein [Rhodospirillales bacterium]|nr:DUF523 domain-containing protein [Rhodospirillales bacterium]